MYLSCNTGRILWSEHRVNGGTGITKFDEARLPLYQQAIAEFGDPEIFLKGNELHTIRAANDLSDFWKVFRRIDAQASGGASHK